MAVQVALFRFDLLHQDLLLLHDEDVFLEQLGLEVALGLVHAVGGVRLLLQDSQLFVGIGTSNERTGLLDQNEPEVK